MVPEHSLTILRNLLDMQIPRPTESDTRDETQQAFQVILKHHAAI